MYFSLIMLIIFSLIGVETINFRLRKDTAMVLCIKLGHNNLPDLLIMFRYVIVFA